MRVNVDSKALNEPRVRRVAKRLNISHYEVLGRCIHVWMVAYERHTEFVPVADVEIACGELPGFVDAIVSEELADLVDERTLRLRGLEERIAFLDKQTEKGKRSGEVRRAMSSEIQKRASVQPELSFGSTGGQTNGSATPRTSSLALAPDLALALAPDHVPIEIGPVATRRTRESTAGAGELDQSDPVSGDTHDKKTAHRSNGEHSEHVNGRSKEPPAEAMTLAALLLKLVIEGNPSSRLARSAERLKEQTVLRWGDSLRKLHKIDRMSWGEIEGMIRWAQRDGFWRTVILGADNLREQWDQMASQRNRKQLQNIQDRPGPTELARRELDELKSKV